MMVAVILLQSACTTQLPVDEKLKLYSWQENRAKIIKLENWELNGRIALSMEP